MGDKEAKLRGQVINKPKEQMWMLKSESVSSILVKGGCEHIFMEYYCKNQIQPTIHSTCTQDLEEYKYTCEPGHMEWTPLNSNLTMQGIKASRRIQIQNTQKKYAKAQIHKKKRKYTNTLEEYKYTSELGHMQRTPSSVGIRFSQPSLD